MSKRTRAIPRALAAALAAAFLVAGAVPVAGAQPPAWLPSPADLLEAPPEAPPGPPPGVQYAQKTQCIMTAVGDTMLTDEPAAQAMLNIKVAQQQSTGRGVRVAIIDTGVNPHPFLRGRLLPGGDYVAPGSGNDGTTDCDGHGTLTAGIVAADSSGAADAAGNPVAFTGVAPGATVLAIRQSSGLYSATGADGQEHTAGTPGTLAAAIVHAVNLGANVITTSVDACEPIARARIDLNTPGSDDRKLQAAVRYAVDKNVVVVNSAGNTSAQPDNRGQQAATCAAVPQNSASDPNDVQLVEVPAVFSADLLAVASVSPYTGAVSPFSVWGPWVNIAAPGEGITSIDPGRNGTGLANQFAQPGANSQPGPIVGTSFAAPYVAGVVALVRAKFPELNARQVIQRIEATAQHPSGPGGRNNKVGYGLINPVAALTAQVPGQDGVPVVADTQVPAVVPGGPVRDWRPMRVALIGTAGAVTLLLVTLFVVRTLRRRPE